MQQHPFVRSAFVIVLVSAGALAACRRPSEGAGAAADAGGLVLREVPVAPAMVLGNRYAYIPPQCYARTQDPTGRAHQGCFVCHQTPQAPTYVDDAALQLAVTLPEPARRNAWANLFEDRSQAVSAIDDEAMLRWVRTSNYEGGAGRLLLADRLRAAPPGWDTDGNGRFDGFVPDALFRFDDEGFDVAEGGRETGWRALAYMPLPGAFLPTNSGSIGDVLVRLPAAYRETASGQPSRAVYVVNLAIVEALTRREDVAIAPVDEVTLGADLDGDGVLARAERVAFQWDLPHGKRMHWVGRAGTKEEALRAPLAPGLLPVGTELLHSLRYLDVQDGRVRMGARMKELRYARKASWRTYSERQLAAEHEDLEDRQNPDGFHRVMGSAERGVSNGGGWILQGFIEDRDGELRPQTYEEQVFCVGCHGGVGATTDDMFSFARKLPPSTFQRGWFHESQRTLEGVDEPRRADGAHEYTHWLAQNGSADDFGSNAEARARFFGEGGALVPEEVERLHADVSRLLLPTPARALSLDKAYKVLVARQRFDLGRDPTVTQTVGAYEAVPEDAPTGIATALRGPRAKTVTPKASRGRR